MTWRPTYSVRAVRCKTYVVVSEQSSGMDKTYQILQFLSIAFTSMRVCMMIGSNQYVTYLNKGSIQIRPFLRVICFHTLNELLPEFHICHNGHEYCWR